VTTMRMVAALTLVLGLAACGGDDKKAEAVVASQASGGRGTAGAGGAGGSVSAYSDSGDVIVSAKPDLAGMPSWTYVAPVLGANPRNVSVSATITPDDAGVILGDDGVNPATALVVKAGVTLTLGETTAGLVNLQLAGPLVVDGTLTAELEEGVGPTRSSVEGAAAAVYVSKKGVVVTRGVDGNATTDGGAGGSFDLNVAGNVFVEGTIDSRGGKGMNGGAGGFINLEVSSGWVVVTGTADSSGGEGLAGVGGEGGDTEIWGRWSANGTGNAYSSGALISRGGNGTAGGGNAGDVYVSSCRNGWAVSTGLLDGSGGDALTSGAGGSANWVEIDASGDKVWASGRMLSRGGKGAGAGAGGSGVYVGVSSNSSSLRPDAVLGGRAAVEADARGGDGATGGAGGEIEYWVERSTNVDPAPLLVAMPEADATGGAGTTAGGAGGYLEASSYGLSKARAAVADVGDVTVDVAFKASGGAASAGAGGEGGEVYFEGDTMKVSACTADGGASTGVAGAAGGTVRVVAGTPPSTLRGALSVKGGAGTAAGTAGTVTVDGVVKPLVDGVFKP